MKLCLVLIIFLLQSCASTQRVTVLSSTALEGLQNIDEIGYTFKDHCNTIHELENYKAIQDNGKLTLGTQSCAEWNRVDSAMNSLLRVVTAYFSGLKNLSDDNTITVYLPPVTKYLRPDSYLGIDIKDKEVSAINTIADKLLSAALGGYRNNKIKKFISESDASIATTLSKLEEFAGLLRTTITSDKSRLLNVYTGLIKEGNNKYQQVQALREFTKLDNDLNRKERQFRSYIGILKNISEAHHEVATKINTLNKNEWQQLIITQAAEIYTLVREFKEL